MSACPTIHSARAAKSAALAFAATLALAGSASAADPTVTRVDGNPNCASLGGGLQELKLDGVPQGRTKLGGAEFVVSGRTFDWTSDFGVDAVIVKGGPNANVYS